MVSRGHLHDSEQINYTCSGSRCSIKPKGFPLKLIMCYSKIQIPAGAVWKKNLVIYAVVVFRVQKNPLTGTITEGASSVGSKSLTCRGSLKNTNPRALFCSLHESQRQGNSITLSKENYEHWKGSDTRRRQWVSIKVWTKTQVCQLGAFSSELRTNGEIISVKAWAVALYWKNLPEESSLIWIKYSRELP